MHENLDLARYIKIEDDDDGHWRWKGVFAKNRGFPTPAIAIKKNGRQVLLSAVKYVWEWIYDQPAQRRFRVCDDVECVNPEHTSPLRRYGRKPPVPEPIGEAQRQTQREYYNKNVKKKQKKQPYHRSTRLTDAGYCTGKAHHKLTPDDIGVYRHSNGNDYEYCRKCKKDWETARKKNPRKKPDFRQTATSYLDDLLRRPHDETNATAGDDDGSQEEDFPFAE